MRVPFRLHPRVFSALGAELVTNDMVAVIELVKNSYDAMARRVDVRFLLDDPDGSMHIEIEDDGIGMSKSIITNVWCVVATPYRLKVPLAKHGKRQRRVSGEKGLGRLAAARLGSELELITKTKDKPSWKVSISWDSLSKGKTLRSCSVDLRKCRADEALSESGTKMRILGLRSGWDQQRLGELSEQLARLVSPFSKIEDFQIWLTHPGNQKAEPLEIKPPEFLSKPPYLVKGEIDELGVVKCKYKYTPNVVERTATIEERIWSHFQADEGGEDDVSASKPSCGPFEFEIRAWDIDAESVEEISKRYDLNRATIRKHIRSYRGISLYRDQILVLPKSESARDWLGLDLRRVSRVGVRLSTNQLVGYVAVTAEKNKDLRDTSDRERLEENLAARDFKKLLQGLVGILEDERSKDRKQAKRKEQPFQDLFGNLSTKDLLDNVNQVVSRGGDAKDIVPLVEEYSERVQDTVESIERRLVYYSRLASLGVLAGMLVHEVRNQTLTMGRLTRTVQKLCDSQDPVASKLEADLRLADKGVRALERLADRLAPLASRTLATHRRDSVVEEVIQDCLAMREEEILKKNVDVKFKAAERTVAAVDPGELVSVILNLLDNALYWISFQDEGNRTIRIRVTSRSDSDKVHVQIDDSGPGIRKGDEERIFWPGVTRKPEGLGMGLTVASELVAQNGGRMQVVNGK